MHRAEGVRILLPQRSLVGFRHLFRQLQRLLPSTHLAVADSETMHRVEGVRMLLPQRSLVGFHHFFRQLQRLLSSTHLAVADSETMHRAEGVRMLLLLASTTCSVSCSASCRRPTSLYASANLAAIL